MQVIEHNDGTISDEDGQLFFPLILEKEEKFKKHKKGKNKDQKQKDSFNKIGSIPGIAEKLMRFKKSLRK